MVSNKTTAGATVAIVKRRFQITCYTEQDTGRLRVDPALIAGIVAGSHTGAKKILIYDAYVHPQSDLDPGNCGAGTTPRDRNAWMVNTLKRMDHLPEVEPPDTHQPEGDLDAEMGEIPQATHQH